MKSFRRSLGILLVLFLFYCSATAFAGILKGPYLMYEGKNTEMAVLWQTDVAESDIICWWTDTNYGQGQATSIEYGDHQHKCVFSGLQPGTRYYYQVDGYGSGSFYTAPSDSATSVKLLAYGDTRSYPLDQEQVVSMMRSAYWTDPAFQTIALHSGDWVASDKEIDWSTQFFVSGPLYEQIHAFQSEVPIQGTRGNHEGAGTYYTKYFPYPYVANFYWSFDYGPAHIIVLDEYTSYAPGFAQYTWLTNDLAWTTKPWKIILSHEPGWSAGGGHENNTDVQNYIQPLAKQYGVDLVINGHNHYYSRAVVDGVQHITTGGGGAPLYTPHPTYPNIVTVDESHHHLEIDIQDVNLSLTARRADGTVIETVTVTHGTTNTPPVASATASATTVTVGTLVTLDGSGSSDPNGDPLTYSWTLSKPTDSAATLTNPTTVNPTFTPDVAGSYVVGLVVNDGVLSSTNTANVTITANAPVNQPPVLKRIGSKRVNENQLLEFTVTATDPDGDALTFLATGLPSGASLTDNGSGTATFSWTPAAGQAGKYSVTISVTDAGGLSASRTFSITVRASR